MFADDCLIFAKATKTATRNIAKVLNDFSHASRQKINFHKSSLYFSNNTHNQSRNDIVNILQIQHKTTIGKYLYNFLERPVNVKELLLRSRTNYLVGRPTLYLRRGGLLLLKQIFLRFLIILCLSLNALISLLRLLIERVENFCGEKTSILTPSRGTKFAARDKICCFKENEGLGIRPGIRVVFLVFISFSCHTRYLNGSCRVTPVKING